MNIPPYHSCNDVWHIILGMNCQTLVQHSSQRRSQENVISHQLTDGERGALWNHLSDCLAARSRNNNNKPCGQISLILLIILRISDSLPPVLAAQISLFSPVSFPTTWEQVFLSKKKKKEFDFGGWRETITVTANRINNTAIDQTRSPTFSHCCYVSQTS